MWPFFSAGNTTGDTSYLLNLPSAFTWIILNIESVPMHQWAACEVFGHKSGIMWSVWATRVDCDWGAGILKKGGKGGTTGTFRTYKGISI
jgi:hypothetical protein